MRLCIEDSLALVVDYQERLLPVIHEKDLLLRNSRILLQGLAALGVPMLVTRQYPKGLGPVVPELLEPLGDAPVYDKLAFSCYDDAAIRKAVDDKKPKNILLCGIEAHVCLLQTLIDVQSAGYQAVLVTDCVGSRNPGDKKYALKRAAQEGALPATYESLLFELTRSAEANAFKTISKLVK